MQQHLHSLGLEPTQVRRYWLHQANLGMNQLIAKKLLGREATLDDAPVILDEFANTASAGSIISFHRHHADSRHAARRLPYPHQRERCVMTAFYTWLRETLMALSDSGALPSIFYYEFVVNALLCSLVIGPLLGWIIDRFGSQGMIRAGVILLGALYSATELAQLGGISVAMIGVSTPEAALDLLTTENGAQASGLAHQLDEQNRERQAVQARVEAEAMAAAAEKLAASDACALVLGSDSWHPGVVGIVAPDSAPLLGFISLVAPALANAVAQATATAALALGCAGRADDQLPVERGLRGDVGKIGGVNQAACTALVAPLPEVAGHSEFTRIDQLAHHRIADCGPGDHIGRQGFGQPQGHFAWLALSDHPVDERLVKLVMPFDRVQCVVDLARRADPHGDRFHDRFDQAGVEPVERRELVERAAKIAGGRHLAEQQDPGCARAWIAAQRFLEQ